MKKIIKAFTLIELLVVTSIITILSISGVFYFFDFVKEQKVSQKLSIIEDNLKDLDKQVKNYNIFDYELNFNTSSTGSKLYITYINNFDTKNQIIEILDIVTGSGIITTIPNTGSGMVKIYKDHKLFLYNEVNRIIPYKFAYNERQSYKITGTLSGEILNDIELNYFTEGNLYPEKNDLLELIEINTQENKSGTNINYLKITNIGGNKKFYNNGIEFLDNTVFLFFENNGKEKFIKIEK